MLVRRSIPTRVGNTRKRHSPPRPRPVHPHACGEYGRRRARPSWPYGPSPRVWGIRATARRARGRCRSIPTRVGNTFRGCSLTTTLTVHPHACGEYLAFPLQAKSNVRSIPTRVGNTYSGSLTKGAFSVHPHACGEYEFEIPLYNVWAGPSPRVWGILKACQRCSCDSGPSPRVWGILSVHLFGGETVRSIPTRVGNTVCQSPSETAPTVHPHACGEYELDPRCQFAAIGPSPRVWGILA